MNDDFDFKNIGKRMPYEVPDAFFDDFTNKVTAEYMQRNARKAKIVHLRRWVSAVAAVVVLGSGVWFAFLRNNTMDAPLAYDIKTKGSTEMPAKTPKNNPKGKLQEKPTVATSKPLSTAKTEKESYRQNPSVKPVKEETLDDALKSLSREELEQLYSVSENDFIYEE